MRIVPIINTQTEATNIVAQKEQHSNSSFKGLSSRYLSRELKKSFVEGNNIQKIKSFILSIFKKRSNPIEIPMVEEALTAFFLGLQREKDFFEELARKKANHEYISTNEQNNANILQKLEQMKVIKPEAPWESPRLVNGKLTDGAYKDIIEKIKTAPSYNLSNYDKKDLINTLARSNYHTEDIIYGLNFQGSELKGSSETISEHSDSIIDGILDFLDDLF